MKCGAQSFYKSGSFIILFRVVYALLDLDFTMSIVSCVKIVFIVYVYDKRVRGTMTLTNIRIFI